MKKVFWLGFAAIILFDFSLCFATNRYVPAGGSPSYTTIQSAVNASSNGDIIIVANGIFTGSGFRDISVNKAITIKSANGPEYCTLDIDFQKYTTNGLVAQGFVVNGNATIEGFTITKARNANYGGAIYCESGSPIIRNCVITNNAARYGGGICVDRDSSPLIVDCVVSNNGALQYSSGNPGFLIGGWGGGIYAMTGSGTRIENCVVTNNAAQKDTTFLGSGYGGGIYGPTSYIKSSVIINNEAKRAAGGLFQGANLIENSIIAYNTSGTLGGGLYCSGFSPTIKNCTIAYNGVSGVYAETNSSPQIVNCILWGNGDDLYNAWSTYSCVEDGDAGVGNISSDPLFASSNDYHLKSTGGRWNGSSWVIDTVSSPCIDSGDPSSVYSLETAPNGGRINMGAYGNTVEASKSAPIPPVCSGPIEADLNNDCKVDLADIALVASHWLECNLQPASACWQ